MDVEEDVEKGGKYRVQSNSKGTEVYVPPAIMIEALGAFAVTHDEVYRN